MDPLIVRSARDVRPIPPGAGFAALSDPDRRAWVSPSFPAFDLAGSRVMFDCWALEAVVRHHWDSVQPHESQGPPPIYRFIWDRGVGAALAVAEAAAGGPTQPVSVTDLLKALRELRYAS